MEPTTLRLPGGAGVWIFILGDTSVFAVLFAVFAVERRRAPAAYEAGRLLLDPTIGLINALVLLTSSLLVVLAVRSTGRRGYWFRTELLSLALLCGVGFVVVTALEWSRLLLAGVRPGASGFFGYYFTVTGIHLLHVLVGIAVLFRMMLLTRMPTLRARHLVLLEGGAACWHLVGLVWVMLFPLFYLVR
ncbi:cytochrome c oxidase subunit 3 [Nocardia sp. NPDC059246]|uniref:cytochrome c oxidase subunit 3 n=1 Tax=unclassified Nocardia TaxID=2637762 RepID=UPI00367DFC9E